MTKRQAMADQTSCLNKILMDEPIFVLRAQDALAPKVVAYWIEQLKEARSKIEPPEKRGASGNRIGQSDRGRNGKLAGQARR